MQFLKLNFRHSVSATDCLTIGGSQPNKTCIFPFTTPSGKQINDGCTKEDHDQFWCQTDKWYKSNDTLWGTCGPDCKIEGMLLGYTANLYSQNTLEVQ